MVQTRFLANKKTPFIKTKIVKQIATEPITNMSINIYDICLSKHPYSSVKSPFWPKTIK